MKKKLKLCFLAPGTSVHTQKWLTSFVDGGHDVHLITKEPVKIDGVKVHSIDIKKRIPIITLFRRMKIIKKVLKNIEPDILHSHYLKGYGRWGALSGFHPFIISTWGSDIVTLNGNDKMYEAYEKRYILKKADSITCTSHFLYKYTKKYTADAKNIFVIPFGVDCNLFSKRRGQKENGIITIAYLKRIRPKYGPEYLVKAFSLVKDQYPKTELLFIGGDDMNGNIQSLCCDHGIGDSVKFIGQIENHKLPQMLERVDILAMPSITDSETFGVSAVEASAMEIPIVATEVGGIPEVVINGVTGFLVEPMDVSGLADAICKLIENPELRVSMGRAGRKHVLRNYTWEANATKMEELYYSLIK